MNRRQFLITSGSFGLTAISQNISFSADNAYKTRISKNENSVIYIFLGGGPSHIETFNPIPDAPADRSSVVGSINTNIVGMRIGGLWKQLSNHADKFSIVHNFAHRDANHSSAVHWMITGEPAFAATSQKWPSYGSVISGHYGPSTKDGLPTYVKMNPIEHDDASWMGAKYLGYDANREALNDLILKGNLTHFKNKLSLIDIVDKNFGNQHTLSKSWTDLRKQAVDILLGNASEAFKYENDKEFGTYKDHQLGKDILTAIRLVERDVKFVTINYGGWDMHSNIKEGFNTRLPALDNYLVKLLESLLLRGLSEKTMVVMTGDFGRTPKVNKDGGRDHWPSLIPLFIANKSYEMGRIIGKSDAMAEKPDGDTFEPEDLKWTMFHHLGVEKNSGWISNENRPMKFIKDEAKNILES